MRSIQQSILLITIAMIMGIAGCERSRFDDQSPYGQDGTAPLYPVIGGTLDPTAPQPTDGGFGEQIQQGENGETPEFLITEPTDKTPVTRQTMVGAWTVSALDTNCQIFLALTKWSGGFRAATRGCVPQVLADFQAWNVKNDTVMMINSSGAQTAILYRTGPERFDGVTVDGAPISFSR